MKNIREVKIEKCVVLYSSFLVEYLDKIRGKKEIYQTIRTGYKDIYWWMEYSENRSYLIVAKKNERPQRIPLSNLRTKKPLFCCPCGCKVAKLYLPQGKNRFECDGCHKIDKKVYEFETPLKKAWFIVKYKQDGRDHSKEIISDINIRWQLAYGKQ